MVPRYWDAGTVYGEGLFLSRDEMVGCGPSSGALQSPPIGFRVVMWQGRGMHRALVAGVGREGGNRAHPDHSRGWDVGSGLAAGKWSAD